MSGYTETISKGWIAYGKINDFAVNILLKIKKIRNIEIGKVIKKNIIFFIFFFKKTTLYIIVFS